MKVNKVGKVNKKTSKATSKATSVDSGYVVIGPKVPNADKLRAVTIINMSSKRKAV